MPISVQTPPGGLLAPGMQVTVVSDLIGPVEPGSFLELAVYVTGEETIGAQWHHPCTSPIFSPALDLEHYLDSTYGIAIPNGADITITTLIHGPSGTFDSGTTTGLTWSTDGQLTNLLKQLQEQSAQGGFTADDRANVEATLANVTVPFPFSTAIPAVLPQGLGQLVSSAPIGVLSQQECRSLVSSGILERPVGAFNVNALGMSWHFLEVPTYFGRKVGSTLEFSQRIVQFTLIDRDFLGQEHVREVLDVSTDDGYVTWGMVQLQRIEYFVSPGCEVQFCWLLLLGS